MRGVGVAMYLRNTFLHSYYGSAIQLISVAEMVLVDGSVNVM